MSERDVINNLIISVGENGVDNLNMWTGDLVVGENKINFSQTETGVLALIIQNSDSVVSYEIFKNIWWVEWSSEEALTNLQVCASRIRKKLKIVDLEKCLVVRNDLGYQWDISKK